MDHRHRSAEGRRVRLRPAQPGARNGVDLGGGDRRAADRRLGDRALASRDIEAERQQVRNWDELAQSLGEASAAARGVGGARIGAGRGVPRRRGDRRARVRGWQGVADVDVRARRRSAVRPSRPARDRDRTTRHCVERAGASRRHRGPSGRAATAAIAGARISGIALRSAAAHRGRTRDRLRNTCCCPQSTPLDDADEALVVAHVDQAARALTRARRHEHEHDVAVALQRSLLPDALPVVDGLELSGRYNAGGVGLEVGGDWYDAVRQTRRDPPPHGRRRGRARYPGGGVDGTTPQCVPRARVRARVAQRDSTAPDAGSSPTAAWRPPSS